MKKKKKKKFKKKKKKIDTFFAKYPFFPKYP